MGESNDMATGYIMGRDSSQGNGYMSGFGGDWAWFLIILVIFGWNGNGGYRGGSSGIADNYVLSSDFATVQRQLSDGFSGVEKGIDTIRNGLCDGFYTTAQLINGTNMAIAQNGYQTQLGLQNLGSQVQTSENAITRTIDNGVFNLSRQIGDGFCSTGRAIEKGFADTNYNMATQNCATLTAIDKVGDRVINYLANEKAQSLRDENQALRLAASQAAQNNYLINQLRPCPIPAYITCNPFGCNCNTGGCASV